MADTIGHSFDEHWLALGDCQISRSLGGSEDRGEIIAIHADCVHAVAHSSGSNAITAVLLLCRGADGVAIVAAEEDDGDLEGRGEVQSSVEVALASCSFAKVTHHHGRLAVMLLRVGSADGLRKLGGERRGYRLDVQLAGANVHGHLATLAMAQFIREELISNVLDREASPREDAQLPILRDNRVLWSQGRSTPNARRLLPRARHVEGDPPLALAIVEDSVHRLKLTHTPVHIHPGGPVQIRQHGSRSHGPIRCQEPEHREHWILFRLLHHELRSGHR
mmetsp:Transcript_23920/g.70165  ORF Transcript_23920/g.70165 Transcript_23920/m.70165 type:complete len:278 (-) Transcript_23920:336-1169(-)